jgi:hypothetical protein
VRSVSNTAKHDHRQSSWIVAGGMMIWCYRCGAWRYNDGRRMRWFKPTGPNGKNPAVDAPY